MRRVCALSRRIHLYISHTDCSDSYTHTLMICSPSTNSLSYLSWWTSVSCLSLTVYSTSLERVITQVAQSGFHHPELFVLAESHFCLWDLSLDLTLKSEQTAYLTFNVLVRIELFYVMLLSNNVIQLLITLSFTYLFYKL